ncbi:CPBP family intramembrane glutamic endopeptidase [Brevundimonas sp.]|uniref:CPBP family intramembrane glutamic endopeptidase n=1 Tax=Brevundimonas sp. TaxID=1871086 RepID=UPI0026361B84|nr:CPBP family intramembrane glutamic endopeptidase [Brevundimonas sp.]
MPRSQWSTVGLAVVSAVSPFMLFLCDRGLLHLIAPWGQPWVDVVLARPASFVVCGLVFVLLAAGSAGLAPWRRSLALGLGIGTVLGAIAVAAVFGGASSPVLPGTAVLGFLVFGLLAEEFLFRGVVFEAFQRLSPSGGQAAVIGSALLLAVSHFGYHSYRLTPEAFSQVAYTFPLGLALGWLRLRTGRIAPGSLAHMMFNLSGLLASRFMA